MVKVLKVLKVLSYILGFSIGWAFSKDITNLIKFLWNSI